MKKKKFAIIALAALLVPSVAARQPQRGYRGFVDAEWSRYSRRLTDYGGWHENHWGVSTVHGYQVMPQLFVGAGAALNCNVWLGSWYPRLFADVRTDLKLGIFTPFADLRAGWTLTSDAGFYFSPTVGYRFNWGRKFGINFGAGITVQSVKYYGGYYDDSWYDPVTGEFDTGYIQANTVRSAKCTFTLRLGFDF